MGQKTCHFNDIECGAKIHSGCKWFWMFVFQMFETLLYKLPGLSVII